MLYLVRHGRTAANAEGRFQGRLDLPLDEVGERQAAAMAEHVRSISVGIDEVWCSSSLRARQTASYYGVEPTIDDRWLEVNFGIYEGLPVADMPRSVWTSWRDDVDFAPEGGESFGSVEGRVRAACADLFARAEDCDIVVVSHMTPIKTAVSWALDTTLAIFFHTQLSQAALCRIGVGRFGPTLHSFNETIPIRDV
ncbi:MAG TPA: histidine phosphatase family protein [Ilumatobacter sp.]|nr:histidine phosphatase family protein [Ilumatobacter sp.]